MACARCPFYVPKESTKGQLLAVKEGINKMLEQVDLTDDEREALEGDRDAITALTERLADIPTPVSPTPASWGPGLTTPSSPSLRSWAASQHAPRRTGNEATGGYRHAGGW